jgi:hypothetical protein
VLASIAKLEQDFWFIGAAIHPHWLKAKPTLRKRELPQLGAHPSQQTPDKSALLTLKK